MNPEKFTMIENLKSLNFIGSFHCYPLPVRNEMNVNDVFYEKKKLPYEDTHTETTARANQCNIWFE